MRAIAVLLRDDPPRAEALRGAGCVVVVADPDAGWGAAVRRALSVEPAPLVLVEPSLDELDALTGPLERDEADVVLARRPAPPIAERAGNRLASLALGWEGTLDALTPTRGFRRSVLAAEPWRGTGLDAEAEVLVKLAAQQYRVHEVPTRHAARRTLREVAALTRTFARYATLRDDADNQHEGYATLANLEAGAPHYNTWLAETFSQWAGRRVLEIGAGIGTITAHLAQGCEHVTAAEVDDFYVRRLRNRFRGQPHVEPYQSDVTLTDWPALAKRGFDTIVLSNVLEHIEDDAAATRTFARILPAGGRLLLFVPALPALFGTLDEAVGHHRRYSPWALRSVLEANGFGVEHLTWMNLVGIAGWFLNGRLLRRRVLPPLQLRLYDQLAPLLARAETRVRLPVGLSLFCVARRAVNLPETTR